MSEILQILLVEDDRDDALITQKALVRVFDGNVTIDHALTLKQGLETLRRNGHEIDLVLLDLNLPDSVGLEGLQAIADETQGTIPIILLTGVDDPDLALEAVGGAAHDYIPKHDLRRDALFRAIQFAIARHRKTVQAGLREATLNAEITELRQREEKLAEQARELEELARTVRSQGSKPAC